MNIKNLLTFDTMITPFIIQIVFWVGTLGSVISGVIMLISGFTDIAPTMYIFAGILIIIIGPLVIRVYCELLILTFKIYEHLSAIRSSLTERNEQFPE